MLEGNGGFTMDIIGWAVEFINNFFIIFNNYAKDNQIVAGALSLWGLGVLSYFGRNVPKQIWALIARQSTTTMTLMSSSQAFYNFTAWFYKQGYSNNIRSIKITSGRWGDDDAVKSIGYGPHYFLHNYVPFKINMTTAENTNSLMERDELKIITFGRSHKFFNSLFKEIQKGIIEEEKIQVYKFRKDYWHPVNSQIKRNLDTVFLEEKVENSIIEHINTFKAKENWYVRNGLSYQTGILLYGHPGCGKTSFVKAIASKYNKPLYILSAGMLHHIEEAVMSLPNKSIFLIEDIDSDPVLHERQEEKNGDNVTSESTPSIKLAFTNFSDVLNALDGIVSVHGRILIATTNHIEKLDTALLRNGRFDLKVEIGYANNLIVENFFKRYYPNFTISSNFVIREKITSSKIQNLILRNLENPEKVLKEVGYE